MQGRTRRAAAVGITALVLAGAAVLGTPASAAGPTPIKANCGDTVTAHPGDVISSPLGLQTVTDGLTSIVGGLLSGLCHITVHVVDTVVAPVPVAGAPVTGAVDGAAAATTNGLTKTVQGATGALPGQQQPNPQSAPSGGAPQTGPNGSTPGSQGGAGPGTIPAPTSPVLGGEASFGSPAYAPMRDYSGIPYAQAGLLTPSPGLRYGGQIPGYAPQFGTLDPGSNQQQTKPVQNAGRAEALPGSDSGTRAPTGLPMLIAVLALSGVSAALVRAWVLRGATD
jgi:hypothetical protein